MYLICFIPILFFFNILYSQKNNKVYFTLVTEDNREFYGYMGNLDHHFIINDYFAGECKIQLKAVKKIEVKKIDKDRTIVVLRTEDETFQGSPTESYYLQTKTTRIRINLGKTKTLIRKFEK